MTENPYESVTHDAELAPPPGVEPPVSIKVLGIINLVFSVLGICGMVFTGVMFLGNVVPQDPNFPNPTMDAFNNNPGYRTFMIVSMVLGFIFSIVLAAGGVGLLQSRRYGRSASIAYAWYAIIGAVVGIVVNYFFLIGPMIEQAQQAEGAQRGAAVGGAIGGAVGGVIGSCMGMAYPIVLLFFMSRPNVIRALK